MCGKVDVAVGSRVFGLGFGSFAANENIRVARCKESADALNFRPAIGQTFETRAAGLVFRTEERVAECQQPLLSGTWTAGSFIANLLQYTR